MLRLSILFFAFVLCAAFTEIPADAGAYDDTRFIPRSMAYVLQADKLAGNRKKAVKKLAESGRDLIILDYSYNTGKGGKWTRQEIGTIQNGKQNRKVVAYISIGEAEAYRPYWKKQWDGNKDGKPDSRAPLFLNVVNPDWAGNYKVRYWQKSWHKIILSYVNEIIAQGFDGIYMDIIDAFEFYEYDAKTKTWKDNRENPETANTYRRDMVGWVKKIASHARQLRPDFLLIPQNGPQLLEESDYLKTIDAIGVEDLFTLGNEKQPQTHVKFVLGFLHRMRQANKPVFLIEYGDEQDARQHTIVRAQQNGFLLLLTDRGLTTLGTAIALKGNDPPE
jgi:cysteinyl-tRNA synthetase